MSLLMYIQSRESVLFILYALNIAAFLWELFISIRQFKIVGGITRVPNELKADVSKETLEKSRRYALAKVRLNIVDITQVTFYICYVLYYHELVLFWESTLICCASSLAFKELVEFVIMMMVPTMVHSPTNFYRKFFLEPQFGFGRNSLAMLKSTVVYVFRILGVFVMSIVGGIAISWFVNYFIIDSWSFIWSWLLTAYIGNHLGLFNTNFLQHFWKNNEEMPDDDLKSEIMNLLREYDIFVSKIVVSHPKGVSDPITFAGRKKEKLVLSDKVLKYDREEVLCLLLRKIADRIFKHDEKMEKYSSYRAYASVLGVLGIRNYYPFYRALGFLPFHRNPGVIGIFAFNYLVLNPLLNAYHFFLCRLRDKYLSKSDAFVLEKVDRNVYRSALIKREIDNLAIPVGDDLYSCYHWNEPPLVERLENLEKLAKKNENS